MNDVVRYARLNMEVLAERRMPVGGQADAVRAFSLHLEPQECMWIVTNDAAGHVHTIIEVARWRHDAVQVDIASVLTAVLATGAPAFSVVHNHPTISVLPSKADIDLTHKLMEAANTVGLLFEDHVIVDPTGDSLSFREAGHIAGAKRTTPRAAAKGRSPR